MSFLDKFLDSVGGDKMDDDYYDENDGYYNEDEDTKKPVKPLPAKEDLSSDNDTASKGMVRTFPGSHPKKVLPQQGGNNMNVCVIRPKEPQEGREIIDTLLADRTVILNLEGVDVDIAQRIVDYAGGATYALHGNMQKISKWIFVITPSSVDLSGDVSVGDLIGNAFGDSVGSEGPVSI